MAKLYFRYGTVGSAKTLNLLAVAHNYRQQSKEVLLLKPSMDDRFGKEFIQSRAGLRMSADLLLSDDSVINEDLLRNISCVLVDEAQFLSAKIIDQFRDIATNHNVPVICYGLRSDFKTKLFEGSKRLLELADTVEEIKTTCNFCNKKSIFNLRVQNGVPTAEGASIQIGDPDYEKYLPVCAVCYNKKLAEGRI